MYNPPSQSNWVSTGPFIEEYARAYEEGFHAYKDGKSVEENPYPRSGHERDTTFSDELHQYWIEGFFAYE